MARTHLSSGRRLVYLHATNHNTQHLGIDHSREGARVLDRFVRDFCGRELVQAVAEEFTEDMCARFGVSESVCAGVARDMGIMHVYCDMSDAERRTAGVPSQEEVLRRLGAGEGGILTREEWAEYDSVVRDSFPIREDRWLMALARLQCDSVLFVCGGDHLESFARLLQSRGWAVQIV